ncbi:MAG: transposase [Bradymonadaceae bacterium]|nr:transposase [Lujinxingiaceae bacterium]
MTDRTFIKRHMAQMAEVQRLFEENAPLFEDILVPPKPKASSRSDATPAPGTDEVEETVPSEDEDDEAWIFFHITSRIHFQRRLFERDEVKDMLAKHCLHYARVCEVGLLHYCLMDNHFHLKIAVRRGALKCFNASKFVGCIKQQFTIEYKRWYNGPYRREQRHRPESLGNGTLWEGRPHIERIEDDAQLAACTLYIEANRVRACAGTQLMALQEPPMLLTSQDEVSRLQPCYEELLERIESYRYQSAGWYISGCAGPEPLLTDGYDGNWASEEELERWWDEPVRELPEGWRKVWFKERLGILKPTLPQARRYMENPFIARLGTTPETRGRTFARLLMSACWHGRKRPVRDDEEGSVPGVLSK